VGQFEIWPAGLFSLKGNCLHRAALAQPRPFMADKPLSAPERYREEARKLHEQAERAIGQHREGLLQIARQYEQLADNVEARQRHRPR
jgi:hypothetical protein